MTDNCRYIGAQKLFHGHVDRVMGTCLDIVTVGEDRCMMTDIWKSLCADADRLDGMLNRFDPESEVFRINSQHVVGCSSMSGELKGIVALAEEYRERTLGLFDVHDCNGRLDLGGFAKGYFLRLCRNMMLEHGVACAFADFGRSSIFGIGHHPYGDSWKVSIIDPYSGSAIKDIDVTDRSVSTSGNSPAYSGHIRNPKTGEFCNDRRMVTVTAADPLDSEVLSTVLMIAGPENRDEIVAGFDDVSYEIHLL